MKNPVEVAETLESDADKLPDLVFSKTGELVSGEPSKAPPRAPKAVQAETVRKPR